MSKVTLSPLCDLTDNFGNFTGFSVNTDGEIVNTSDCPFPFLDEMQDEWYIAEESEEYTYFDIEYYFRTYKRK